VLGRLGRVGNQKLGCNSPICGIGPPWKQCRGQQSLYPATEIQTKIAFGAAAARSLSAKTTNWSSVASARGGKATRLEDDEPGELDALAKLPADQQKALIKLVQKGEKVSAKTKLKANTAGRRNRRRPRSKAGDRSPQPSVAQAIGGIAGASGSCRAQLGSGNSRAARRLTGRSFAGFSPKSPPAVVMVTRADRLARSTRDLLNTLAAIGDRKAGFRSLADAWADTTTAHGRLMLTVLGGLAEFERDLIRAHTGEGRARAKAAGKSLGRKPKLTPHQKQEAISRRDRGEAVREIART
jgi:Resolvase, N terminal domain